MDQKTFNSLFGASPSTKVVKDAPTSAPPALSQIVKELAHDVGEAFLRIPADQTQAFYTALKSVEEVFSPILKASRVPDDNIKSGALMFFVWNALVHLKENERDLREMTDGIRSTINALNVTRAAAVPDTSAEEVVALLMKAGQCHFMLGMVGAVLSDIIEQGQGMTNEAATELIAKVKELLDARREMDPVQTVN